MPNFPNLRRDGPAQEPPSQAQRENVTPRLRRGDAESYPAPDDAWAERFQAFQRQAAQILPQLPQGQGRSAGPQAARAVRVPVPAIPHDFVALYSHALALGYAPGTIAHFAAALALHTAAPAPRGPVNPANLLVRGAQDRTVAPYGGASGYRLVRSAAPEASARTDADPQVGLTHGPHPALARDARDQRSWLAHQRLLSVPEALRVWTSKLIDAERSSPGVRALHAGIQASAPFSTLASFREAVLRVSHELWHENASSILYLYGLTPPEAWRSDVGPLGGAESTAATTPPSQVLGRRQRDPADSPQGIAPNRQRLESGQDLFSVELLERDFMAQVGNWPDFEWRTRAMLNLGGGRETFRAGPGPITPVQRLAKMSLNSYRRAHSTQDSMVTSISLHEHETDAPPFPIRLNLRGGASLRLYCPYEILNTGVLTPTERQSNPRCPITLAELEAPDGEKIKKPVLVRPNDQAFYVFEHKALMDWWITSGTNPATRQRLAIVSMRRLVDA